MKKVLVVVVQGLLWCTASYLNIITKDLIDAFVVTNKPKSIKVANSLKTINYNDK